jgi:hypothetical protein
MPAARFKLFIDSALFGAGERHCYCIVVDRLVGPDGLSGYNGNSLAVVVTAGSFAMTGVT